MNFDVLLNKENSTLSQELIVIYYNMFHLRSVYDHLWILESLFLRVGYNTKVEN